MKAKENSQSSAIQEKKEEWILFSSSSKNVKQKLIPLC